MAKHPDVDPDAATVMPVGRREDAAAGGGAKVVLEVGTERQPGLLVSVSGREIAVQLAKGVDVDAEVTLVHEAGRPKTKGIVVWTRSQGASVVVGVALPDEGAAKPWSKLVG